ncbi:MAG: hypothetical protein HY220_01810 [Candidatus Sungbacteria bacterium]|uniref:Uncharacterized protein n=1 Tax=Candidatus Sungiibacteriota bacterium TaxID=2750080 RepID=A0A9D6LN92_9BACT|nr:hypothetical protein [Candidatus Sungbacteria bacterium]
MINGDRPLASESRQLAFQPWTFRQEFGLGNHFARPHEGQIGQRPLGLADGVVNRPQDRGPVIGVAAVGLVEVLEGPLEDQRRKGEPGEEPGDLAFNGALLDDPLPAGPAPRAMVISVAGSVAVHLVLGGDAAAALTALDQPAVGEAVTTMTCPRYTRQ